MDIYLIRHTRLAIDSSICYGQSEIELAPEFETQLQQLKLQLPGSFASIYSSPLQRCRQLAQQFGESITEDKRLLEYHFGDWELQAWDDIDPQALNHWMQDFVNIRPPRGETLTEMFYRVAEFLDELRQTSPDPVLIATHSGVFRCVWACLLQIPLSQIFKLNVGYGKVLHIRLGDNDDQDMIFTD